MHIRNIAIIAHVDHGKTTLTDAILRQTGAVSDESTSMDNNALEKERGITIYAKNASINYKDVKINIVDTPGHADFGSEVERVLKAIDCVLLIVDAQEGPMPQTRFVLKKSLELGIRPIVVVNKIDKPAADPKKCLDEVFNLFLELGASDTQAEFPVVYAIGREGVAKLHLEDEFKDLTPLLDTIINFVPESSGDDKVASGLPDLIFQPFNLGYDNFLGRLAIGRIYKGNLKVGNDVFVKLEGKDNIRKSRITKIFGFIGQNRVELQEAFAGDIVMLAGIEDIDIGETVVGTENIPAMPSIKVDPPTISMNFMVNDSPFAGREGKFVTSRQLRERLEKELQVNVGLKVDFVTPDNFIIYGRGELHISILLENMRREGYEMQVSQPRVIIQEVDGIKMEPYEEVVVDVPSEFQGAVIERLGTRGFQMKNMSVDAHSQVRLVFEGPTRGFLGYRNQFVVDTRGLGIISSRFIEFRAYYGDIKKRLVGSMISMITGKALSYALWNLEDRGTLYIGPSTEVYEGMVIGDTSKGEDMAVNPTKGKQLTNMRAASNDEAIQLTPHQEMTIEKGLEIMREDEYLEITPISTRLRKQFLTETERNRSKKK